MRQHILHVLKNLRPAFGNGIGIPLQSCDVLHINEMDLTSVGMASFCLFAYRPMQINVLHVTQGERNKKRESITLFFFSHY